jgi:molecular chaperone Hsp33
MKKVKLYGNTLKEQLIASRRDRLYSYLLADETIRCVVLNATRMVNEMRWNHGLGVLETLALAHAYMGIALMSSSLKGNDRIGMQIECSGPIKGLSVEANAYGEVRGYLKQVPIPLTEPVQSFNLSPFFGAGFLSVTKFLEDSKQPFIGKVMLEHGTVAKDLALYHLMSEQIATAFSLSVKFDRDGEVIGAGGMMFQALPGADDKLLEELEQLIGSLPSIGKAVIDPDFPQQWVSKHFEELDPRELDQRGVEFMCHCSHKRIRHMLLMLKPEDLDEMAHNGPFPIQVRCHYCNTSYDFDQQQMKAISVERHSKD